MKKDCMSVQHIVLAVLLQIACNEKRLQHPISQGRVFQHVDM